MKVALKFNNDRWKTFKKIKAVSVATNFVILTGFDGDIKVFASDEIKHIRETKLYEKGVTSK